MPAVDPAAREKVCPACNAQPGEPCTQPTDTGRRPVTFVEEPEELQEPTLAEKVRRISLGELVELAGAQSSTRQSDKLLETVRDEIADALEEDEGKVTERRAWELIESAPSPYSTPLILQALGLGAGSEPCDGVTEGTCEEHSTMVGLAGCAVRRVVGRLLPAILERVGAPEVGG